MDKFALVTGAYRGLGFETVRLLLNGGFKVFVCARSLSKAQGACQRLALEGTVWPVELDVTSQTSIQSALKQVSKTTPSLHLLINNAGTMSKEEWLSPPEAMTKERLLDALNVNLIGPLEVSKTFLPLLENAAGARIVNVSSTGGSIEQMPSMMFAPAYQVSKAALNALTRELSVSLKAKNIAVIAVCPGWCRTEMGGENAPRSVEEGARSIYWAAAEAPIGASGGFFRDGEALPW